MAGSDEEIRRFPLGIKAVTYPNALVYNMLQHKLSQDSPPLQDPRPAATGSASQLCKITSGRVGGEQDTEMGRAASFASRLWASCRFY